jgi:hypothetical protein
MTTEDVYTTLLQNSMISMRETTPPIPKPSPGQSIKLPKGRKNGLSRRPLSRSKTQKNLDDEHKSGSKAPFVAPAEYDIQWDPAKVEEYLRNWESKRYLKLKPERLKWSPFLLTRTKKTDSTEATRPMDLPVATPNGQSANDGDAVARAVAATELANSIFNDADNPVSVDTESVQDADTLPALNHAGLPKSRKTTSTRSPRHVQSVHSTPAGEATDDDEALAARLAAEERMIIRQLRPRSRSDNGVAAGHETNRTTPSTSRSVSPKKRRRLLEPPAGAEAVVEHLPRQEPDVKDEATVVSLNGSSNHDQESTLLPRRRGRKPSLPVRKSPPLADESGNGFANRQINGRHSTPCSNDAVSTISKDRPNLVMTTTMFELTEESGCDLDSPLTGITSQRSTYDEDIRPEGTPIVVGDIEDVPPKID